MHSSSDYTLETTRRRELQPPACHPNCSSSGGAPGAGGAALETAAGIALTGSYIFNALAGGNVDAVENEASSLDVCLSHPAPSGEFHYHWWSACLKKDQGFWSDSVAPALCRDTSGCVSSPAQTTIYGTTNS